MTRLDWDKARRDRMPRERRPPPQKAMTAFVKEHQLFCFKCGEHGGPWAKTGVSSVGPWALCQACVEAGR